MQNDQTQLTPAWLLEVKPDFLIALSEQSVVEYIPHTSLKIIPGSVDYCNSMLMWRNSYIPVFDFRQMIDDSALATEKIAVVAYQEQQNVKPNYVAIKLCKEVEKIQVSDDQMTDWPDDYPVEIRPLVESLFEQQGSLLSVINVADLSNEGFRDYLQQLKA